MGGCINCRTVEKKIVFWGQYKDNVGNESFIRTHESYDYLAFKGSKGVFPYQAVTPDSAIPNLMGFYFHGNGESMFDCLEDL
jgi:hypothetical protein